jgi:hypothetical protein
MLSEKDGTIYLVLPGDLGHIAEVHVADVAVAERQHVALRPGCGNQTTPLLCIPTMDTIKPKGYTCFSL